MSEIGGYFELECGYSDIHHSNAIHLNSGQNCLRYLVRAHQIERIFVPAYINPVIWDALRDEGREICFYYINDKWATYQFLSENNFYAPRTWLTLSECEEAYQDKAQPFPLIVKPRWRMGSLDIYEAENI